VTAGGGGFARKTSGFLTIAFDRPIIVAIRKKTHCENDRKLAG